MNNFIDDLEKRLNIIEELSQYSIEFGIFTEDGIKTVTVNVLNTDDTISKISMEVGDVMYLTEHGTLTIPARPILDNCIYYISNNLYETLNKIIDEVLEFNLTRDQIIKKLEDFCIKMQIWIQAKMVEIVNSNATLSNLLNISDENKYLYDLRDLKNYIKCKIIFSESRRN